MFFRLFLFLSLIYLHESFKMNFLLYNIDNIAHFRMKNKLQMGCDYYIDKDLHIYFYNKNDYFLINLEHERGYFYEYPYDPDEEDYEQIMNEMIKEQLQPRMKPIVIYSNNTFTKPHFENKYKTMIESVINNDLYKDWDDVKEIIKVEDRYLR